MDETKSKKRDRSVESDHPTSKKKRGEEKELILTAIDETMEEELDCKNSIRERNIVAENRASQPKKKVQSKTNSDNVDVDKKVSLLSLT